MNQDLTVERKKDGTTLFVAPKGFINVMTADIFGEALEDLEGIEKVIIDFKETEYITSAGLRCMMAVLQYTDENGGEVIIRNADSEITEILNMTGMVDLLVMEE